MGEKQNNQSRSVVTIPRLVQVKYGAIVKRNECESGAGKETIKIDAITKYNRHLPTPIR